MASFLNIFSRNVFFNQNKNTTRHYGIKENYNNKTVPNIHLDQNAHGKVLHIILYLLLKPILRNE